MPKTIFVLLIFSLGIISTNLKSQNLIGMTFEVAKSKLINDPDLISIVCDTLEDGGRTITAYKKSDKKTLKLFYGFVGVDQKCFYCATHYPDNELFMPTIELFNTTFTRVAINKWLYTTSLQTLVYTLFNENDGFVVEIITSTEN